MRAAFTGALLVAGLAGTVGAQNVVQVRADNQPLWGDPAPLQRELRLGVVDGREEQTFGRIVAIAVSTDGELWIADAQASTIRRFAANGR
jgi:glucose/arabinose dehydrogenase